MIESNVFFLILLFKIFNRFTPTKKKIMIFTLIFKVIQIKMQHLGSKILTIPKVKHKLFLLRTVL